MIEPGKTVKVHYTGTLSDGSVFDSSEGRDPLEFKVGAGQVIPGFDAAIQTMDVGSCRTVTIPSAEAYGDVQPEQRGLVPHDRLPDGLMPEIGQTLEFRTPQGALPVRIIEIQSEGIVVDANHPLAGQDLTFELTVVEVA